MAQARPLFIYFLFFSHDKYSTNTINDKSVDGVLGSRTQGGRMVGTDESTDMAAPHLLHCYTYLVYLNIVVIRIHKIWPKNKNNISVIVIKRVQGKDVPR